MSSQNSAVATRDQKEGNRDTETVHIEVPPNRSTTRAVAIILTCFSGMVLNSAILTSSSIALPDIGRELHIEQDRLQWVQSAFALSSGCFLLLCGRLADLHGRKLTFLVGTAWLGIFSIGCGFAQTEAQLYILRGLQGIGGAAAVPAALGVLAQSFPPGRIRSIGFATFSAGAPFGGGFGFIIGGIVAQLSAAKWRGVFFLTAGLCALPFFAGLFCIDPDLPSTEPNRSVDWVGAALASSGLVLVTFVLGQGEIALDGWQTPYIIALFIVGVLLVIAFLFWENYLVKHTTRPPLMRLDLWTRAHGKFAAIQCIAFLEWSAFFSWILWVQLYFQTYKNYTPIQSMLRFLPSSITGLTINFIVGVVVGRVNVLYLLILGTMATGSACVLFATINVSSPYWAFEFPSSILVVWGADFVFACGTLFVARVALPHEQSVAGGVLQTILQLGTSFGLAITTIVQNKTVRKEIINAGMIPDSRLSNAPPMALLKGYRNAQWTGFAFAMCAMLLTLVFFRNVGVVGGSPQHVPDAKSENSDEKNEKSVEVAKTDDCVVSSS